MRALCLGILLAICLPAGIASAGTVTGTVTDQISGAPVSGLRVGIGLGTSLTHYTTTAADGTYSFADREAGKHYVCFMPAAGMNLLKRCWRDEQVGFYGEPIEVLAEGTVEGIDTVMAPGTSIAGTVRSWEGSPLAGVCVSAWTPAGGGWRRAADATTAADGSYTLVGLTPEAENRVVFNPSSSFMGPCTGGIEHPGLVSQWFDRKPSMAEATAVRSRRSETRAGVDGWLGEQAVPPSYYNIPDGRCVVPRLKGRTFSSARRALARAGCSTPMPALKASRVARGRVLASRPAARKRVARGAAVKLTVSRGR
jgi:hypothetical protein